MKGYKSEFTCPHKEEKMKDVVGISFYLMKYLTGKKKSPTSSKEINIVFFDYVYIISIYWLFSSATMFPENKN